MKFRLELSGAQGHKFIEFLTVAYLALPTLLFLAGWLKPLLALPAIAVTLAALLLYVRQVNRDYKTRRPKPRIITTKKTFIIVAAVLSLWVLVSGVGGLGNQNNDYNKHNAIIADLTTQAYPVQYNTPDGQTKPLVYYVGYYLPASVAGKMFGSILVAQICLMFWTVIGVALALYWIARIIGKLSLPLVLGFILFSGLDIVGFIITGNIATPWGGVVEWYLGPSSVTYSAFTTILFWGPQLAISGWLFTALLLAAITEQRSAKNIAFVASLSLIWSPFITLGLLPVLGAYLLAQTQKGIQRLRGLLSFQNCVAAIVLGVIFLLYFAAGNHTQQLGWFGDYSATSARPWGIEAIGILLFLVLEFGMYAALVFPYVRQRLSSVWVTLLLLSVVTLALLPLLRYGYVNDIVAKASIPSLLIIFLVLYMYLLDKKHMHTRRWVAAVVMVSVGAITPLLELRTHLMLTASYPADAWGSLGNPTIPEAEKKYAEQYLGDRESFFYRRLAP